MVESRAQPIKCSRMVREHDFLGFFSRSCAATSTSVVRQAPPSPPLLSSPTQSIADHVGQIQPAIRAHCRCSSQHRNPPVHGTLSLSLSTRTHVHISNHPRPPNRPLNHAQLTSQFFQRAASSSSGAESSQWATTATASAATVFAVGSAAWYYYQFGREAHAMTPAEEGYVIYRLYTHSTIQC